MLWLLSFQAAHGIKVVQARGVSLHYSWFVAQSRALVSSQHDCGVCYTQLLSVS